DRDSYPQTGSTMPVCEDGEGRSAIGHRGKIIHRERRTLPCGGKLFPYPGSERLQGFHVVENDLHGSGNRNGEHEAHRSPQTTPMKIPMIKFPTMKLRIMAEISPRVL